MNDCSTHRVWYEHGSLIFALARMETAATRNRGTGSETNHNQTTDRVGGELSGSVVIAR